MIGLLGKGVNFAVLAFTATWTTGTCDSCKIAQFIDVVQFTAPGHAWAYGCRSSWLGRWAVFGQQPYYNVVQAADAGRTWSEIARVKQYPDHPEFSFVDANHGWISWNEGMIRTADGGRKFVTPNVLAGSINIAQGAKFAAFTATEMPCILFHKRLYEHQQ